MQPVAATLRQVPDYLRAGSEEERQATTLDVSPATLVRLAVEVLVLTTSEVERLSEAIMPFVDVAAKFAGRST